MTGTPGRPPKGQRQVTSTARAVDVAAVVRHLIDLAFESGGYEGAEANGPAYERWQDAITVGEAIEELLATQATSLAVLRSIVRDANGGVHQAAAKAACQQAAAALRRAGRPG